MKYNLTSNFLDLIPLVKGLNIYIHVRPFFILLRWYWSWPAKEGRSRGLSWYNSLWEELLVLNTRGDFLLVCVFNWNDFSHKKQINHTLAVRYWNRYPLPPPTKSTMISHVVTYKEGMEMKNQTKTKIGLGCVVKSKVGELEKITSEGRSRRMRK